MNPKFPLYIVSKGRSDTRLTSKALERMQVPYSIVIERQDFPQYSKVIDPKKILILDTKYQDQYEVLDNLNYPTNKVGPGAARNFAWEHSLSNGHKWHWVMDDNINHFYRMNNNLRIRVTDGTIFKCMEDFILRYVNIAMAGPNYRFFAASTGSYPPFSVNTRIYSCNLIRNDVPFRWRGRFNEDTILSLDMLKAGYCTVQFYAFLQGKAATQTVKGGNTTIYKAEGTKIKSEMLIKAHPDVSRLVFRYGRWHHHVDYKPFKNMPLIRKPDVQVQDGVDNYGMVLKEDDTC